MDRIERAPSKLANDTYDRLVAALIDGTLAPGDRLVQDQLAEQLDVSRTPVRDALLRLRAEGIITPVGRRGYVVRSLSARDVLDNYDARMAIESYAAARVAARGGSAVAHVQAVLDRETHRAFDTPHASYLANRAIHEAVVRATDNPQLLGCFESVWNRALSGLIYRDFYDAQSADEFVETHVALVDILAAGDPERARLAMIDHIQHGLDQTPARDSAPTNGG